MARNQNSTTQPVENTGLLPDPYMEDNDPAGTAPLPQEGDGIVAPPPDTTTPPPVTSGNPSVEMPSGTEVPQVSETATLDRGLLNQGLSTSGTPQVNINPTAGLAPTTREVQENELVSHQLDKLLSSSSPYMRQARLQGLSLGGGLGGTAGIRASMGAAIERGLPIAQADAQAYRDAASQNMNALNQFTLATMQRTTQLELGNLDAATRIKTTSMNNAMQAAVAQLNAVTQKQLANLDAATKVRVTELNGQIQARLSDLAYRQNLVLNDQQNAARLEQIAVQGEYNLAVIEMQAEVNREATYVNAAMTAYNGILDRIEALNGLEMDDAARARAEAAIWESGQAAFDLLAGLYPDLAPITFTPGG